MKAIQKKDSKKVSTRTQVLRNLQYRGRSGVIFFFIFDIPLIIYHGTPYSLPPNKTTFQNLDQYTAQVVLGRGDNRATFNFLPELFSEGSKAVK